MLANNLDLSNEKEYFWWCIATPRYVGSILCTRLPLKLTADRGGVQLSLLAVVWWKLSAPERHENHC
jgi:hypothetical protein